MLLGGGQLFRAGLCGLRHGGKVMASLPSRAPSLLSSVQRQQDQSVAWSEKQRREFTQLNSQSQLMALKPSALQLQLPRHSSGSHAGMFKLERVWAAAMVPLFPAAYWIHTPLMDYALAVALAMHIHWGLHSVVVDYGRPIILGETLSKVAANSIYLVSLLMFVGLLSFNYNDVGITKAFEMVWSL